MVSEEEIEDILKDKVNALDHLIFLSRSRSRPKDDIILFPFLYFFFAAERKVRVVRADFIVPQLSSTMNGGDSKMLLLLFLHVLNFSIGAR